MSTPSAKSKKATSHSVKSIIQVIFRWFERVFVGVFFFFSSGAILQEVFREGGWVLDPSWAPFVWGTLYLVLVVMSFIRYRETYNFISTFNKDHLLVLFVAYIFLSVIWSVSIKNTIKSLFSFGGLTLFSIYVSANFSLRKIYEYISLSIFVAAILSVLTAIIFPDVGLYYDSRGVGISGVFGNKNVLGRAFSVGASISFFLGRDSGVRNRRFWMFCFLLFLVLILLSNSKTSLVTIFAIFLIAPSFRLLRAPGKLVIPALIAIGGLAIGLSLLVYLNWQEILTILGRSASLSGRIPMWATTAVVISDSPWLGYGYGVQLAERVSSYEYMEYITWEPTHAHNGFLQMVFELGFSGAVIFFMHIFVYIKRSIYISRSKKSYYSSFIPISFLAAYLLAGSTQSIILPRYGGLFWVVYVIISLSLKKEEIRYNKYQ